MFDPPYLLRMVAGLRHGPLTPTRTEMERVLGVRLRLGHDLDLGDGHYTYDPRPVPPRGLIGAQVLVNDIPGHGMIYADNPDIELIVAVDWIGDSLLDLGLLHDALHHVFSSNYAAIEYSGIKLPPPNEKRAASQIHCVRFALSDNEFCPPLHKAPVLDCALDFLVAPRDTPEVQARLAGSGRWPGLSSHVTWDWLADEAQARLRATFASPSLLDLGRCARAVEARTNDAARVAGYDIRGDLLRYGTEIFIAHMLSPAERRSPAWRAE